MYLNKPDPGLDDLSWMSMSLDSESSSHPSTISLSSWGVAIGMHPKHSEELTSKHFAHMRDLLSSP